MHDPKFTVSDNDESRTVRFILELVRYSKALSKVFREKAMKSSVQERRQQRTYFSNSWNKKNYMSKEKVSQKMGFREED